MTNLKILIVEDDRFISDMYEHALGGAGYDVTVAVTGPEGVEKASTGEFGVVLLDIMLPDQTGKEVLDTLIDRRVNASDMRILIMTNYVLDDAEREDLENKADGYLIKADITPSELVELIKGIENDT